MMDKKMDPKKKEKMMKKLEELGIDKEMVDERLMWGAKEMMFGMMKVVWSLKENGMSDEQIKEVIQKMMTKMSEMDMSEKMEKMKEHHEHWKENHEHMHAKGCGCKKDEGEDGEEE
jgi:hypothetical protein